MPRINVEVQKYVDGGATARPAVMGRVHSLSASDKERFAPRTLVIPAGAPNGISVDLPVGTYLFEAYLPSGDVASRTAAVREGANEPVLLRAADSPREWLSWHHLTGEAPIAPPAARELAPPKAIEVEVVTSADPPTAFAKKLLDVWKGTPAASLQWAPIAVAPRPGATEPLIAGAVTAYLFGAGPWQEGSRYYGLVSRPPAGPPLLAVLPLPWRQADFSGDAETDLMVDATGARAGERREWPVRVAVVARDNIMASVFGYLGSGDLPAAAEMVETAVDLLYGKMQNALAAAGGAYILVRSAARPQQRPMWEPWLRNLRNWFAWLPDGAILDGWAHLEGIGRAPSVKEAAGAFVEAVSRGLPFYSAGVRLLFEGLTRVEAASEPSDRPPGFATAFEFVRRLALRVDVRQPFTVVRLG